MYTLFTIRSLSFFSFYIAFFFYFYTSVSLTPLYASDTRVVTRVSRARTCWFIIVLDIILIRCKLLGCIMYVAICSPRYLLSSSLASFCSPDEARILVGTWNISGNRFRIIKEVRILICIFFPSISLSINLIIISRRLLQFFFIFNCLYNNFSVSMIRVINLEKQFKTLWIILKSKQSSGSFRFQISNDRGRRINGGASARELISRRWSWGEGERGSRFVSSRDYLYTSNRPRDLNFWNGRFARPTGWSAAK